MGRSTLQNKFNSVLFDKQAFGESRHLAKQELREQGNYHFGDTDDKIHSVVTFNTYKEVAERFAKYCIEEKGVSKYASPEQCKQYAKDFLQDRLDKNMSVWTVKMERSALGKIYNERIEIDMPKRDTKEITRSRGQEKINHFSEKNNQDIVNIARATGCRRSDLKDLKPSDFYIDKNNNVWVEILGSKGGRDRLSPVLPEYKEFITNYIKDKDPEKTLFDKVPVHMDVHHYRDLYAQDLYNTVKENKEYKAQLLERYPERHEYKTIKDKETGEKKTVEITSKTFTTRGENRETFDRDDVYIVSQALGHNRLDVSITHYLSAK